jgi:hypothetical protein
MTNYTHKGKYGKTRIRNIRLSFACLYLLAILYIGGKMVEKPILISPLLAQEELAALPTPTPTPTLRNQIEAYGSNLFGTAWPIFKRIIQCESGWQTGVVSKTQDTGLTQISWVHGISKAWLKNWRVNLTVANELYKSQGLSPWRSSRGCWQK